MVPINKVKSAESFTLEKVETELLWFMNSISPKRQFIFLASLFLPNLNGFPYWLKFYTSGKKLNVYRTIIKLF